MRLWKPSYYGHLGTSSWCSLHEILTSSEYCNNINTLCVASPSLVVILYFWWLILFCFKALGLVPFGSGSLQALHIRAACMCCRVAVVLSMAVVWLRECGRARAYLIDGMRICQFTGSGAV